MFPTVYEIPFHYAHPVTGTPPTMHADAPESIRSASRERERSSTAAGAASTWRDAARDRGAAARDRRAHRDAEDRARSTRRCSRRSRTRGSRSRATCATDRPSATCSTCSRRRSVAGPRARSPSCVFVHGGGFARGSKHTEGTPFYDNIGALGRGLRARRRHDELPARAARARGRRASRTSAPPSRGSRRTSRSTAAIRSKILLWGHSAGAAHVGDYVASRGEARRDAGVAGAILTSGFYDLGKEVSVWKVYYGDDVVEVRRALVAAGARDDRRCRCS